MNKISAEKLNIFIIVYINDIFIYTGDQGQTHINVVWWVFKKSRKNVLFANLKKCQFYKNKIHFLGYVVLAKKMQIKDERIDKVKNWPE